jgi:hypothetical protein
MWLRNNGGRCRWAGEADFMPMVFGVRGFELSGVTQANGAIALQGRYKDCTGNCPVLFPKGTTDFETELRLAGDQLIDTNKTPDPKDDLYFVTQAAESKRETEVGGVLRGLLGDMDHEKVDEFLTSDVTPEMATRTPKDAFLGFLKTAHGQAPILSREMFRFVGASSSVGDYALQINNMYLSGNRNSLEFVFLKKLNGKWLIDFLAWE